jgi:hypothetical protein
VPPRLALRLGTLLRLPRVAGLDDYLLCPAIDQWLPGRLGDAAALWTTLGRVPSAVRRLRRAVVSDAPGSEGLVIVARLSDPVDAVPLSVLRALRPGALVADVCLPGRRGPLEWILDPVRSRRLHAATATRLAGWLARGLHDVEQWVAVDPADAVVTLGRVRG